MTAADTETSAAVAVVGETLVERVFPNEDPLGKRPQVAIGRPGGTDVTNVGVVGDVKFASRPNGWIS